MKTIRYTKFLIASVVSMSMVTGQVVAQNAPSPAAAPAAPTSPVDATSAPSPEPVAASAVAAAPAPAAPEPASAAVAAPPAAPAPIAAAPVATDAWQQEFALWQAAASGNTIDEYQGYLTAYPSGKFAAIAQARIVKLTAADEALPEGDAMEEAHIAPAQERPAFTVGTPGEESVILADTATRREVQGRLTSLGFSTGGTDSVLGPRSRTAISNWQTVIAAPVSGFLSYDQLTRLREDSANAYPTWLASRPKPLPPIRRSKNDELVGRVPDNSADAAIALGVLGLAAGVIGGAAMSRGRHYHHGPRYHRGGPRFHGHRRHR